MHVVGHSAHGITQDHGDTASPAVPVTASSIGKGIALELGAAGATVYCAGRSTRSAGQTTERALGDSGEATVDATAEE